MADSLTFIGNATTLLRLGPFTLLTDPNFLHRGQRAYLGKGLTSKRLTEPAMTPEELPPLDAIVLSHLHGDHWDRVAQRRLPHTTPVVTTEHAARRLRGRAGFRNAVGLDTWQSRELTKDDSRLRITSMPGRHALGFLQRLLPPVMGSLLELTNESGEVTLRLYITGDTLYHENLREVVRRHPDVHTCVLHLGGTTLPGGFVVTMDGRQGAQLLELVGPRQAVPVHYDDYKAFKSPLEDFRTEVDARGLGHLVSYVERGATISLAHAVRE
jgi:L-ascorbate metabolism protein UlaG (beta-lactamase superfamily)